jgi:hypothetical protein
VCSCGGARRPPHPKPHTARQQDDPRIVGRHGR